MTLRIDGKRVLVLVDASASMLDETVVNIIRLRNMPPERRIASAKWQQAVSTVEWVAARLPQIDAVPGLRIRHRPRGRWSRAAMAAG